MFFALADNDRARFDRLLEWTQKNMAAGSLATHLPGWLWGKARSGEWKLLDANSAADADCWMAYSLVEAGRLWNNPTYATLGRQMMDLIAKQEVADLPGFGYMLMPGATSEFVHGQTWTVNPSYVPLFVFERFDAIDPAGPWGAIALNLPRLLRQSTRQGFAMDWVNYQSDDGFIPAPGPAPDAALLAAAAQAEAPAAKATAADGAKPASAPASPKADPGKPADPAPAANTQTQDVQPATPRPPMGSYDAIRVYLWAGMTNPADGVRTELIAAVPAMGNYLTQHGAPPEKVNADGNPQPQAAPIGFSAALLPYLSSDSGLAHLAAQQRIRMGQQRDPATGLYGKDPAYYDQNLALFATGFLDERFGFGPHGELKVEWTR